MYARLTVTSFILSSYSVVLKGELQQLIPGFVTAKKKLIGNGMEDQLEILSWRLAHGMSEISELKS